MAVVPQDRFHCIYTHDIGRLHSCYCDTVEPVLKDYPIGHEDMVSQVFGDRSIYIEMYSRQAVSDGSGLSRQVLLYR